MIDNPITWGEMTDAEKGALLLAHHEGKVIELFSIAARCWLPFGHPLWRDHKAYRVKPEPKRETVTFYGRVSDIDGGWLECWPNIVGAHRITFDTIDGKPDCDSIRMEELGA